MSLTASITPEQSRALEEELLSGESVLWTGQPSRSVIFHSSDWTSIPFSLFWVGFTAFWEYGATNHGQRPQDLNSGFFALWGVPFILMGQYMLWGRFLYEAWRKPRTIYALTNKRVLNLQLGGTRKVVDGSLATLNSVSLTSRANGIGTIEFSPEPVRENRWGNRNRRNQLNQMGLDLSRLAFFDIPDSRDVYQRIQAERDRVQAKVKDTIFSS
jgi:hypothetical protein